MDAALTWLTPLSIASSSTAPAVSGKRKDVSFEEKVKNKTLKDFAPPVLKIDSPYRQHRKRIKKEDLESLEHNSIKLSDLPLSSASMVTTPCMRVQGVDKENQAEHKLHISSDRRIASPASCDATNSNKLSVSETYLNTNLLISGPAVQNTLFSDSEEDPAIDLGTTKRIGRKTPHSSAFTASTFRNDRRSVPSDAYDGHEVSDAETQIESCCEDECQPGCDRDEQGLSTGVKQLVLGKHERLNDDVEEKEDDTREGKLILYKAAGRRGGLNVASLQQIEHLQGRKRVKVD